MRRRQFALCTTGERRQNDLPSCGVDDQWQLPDRHCTAAAVRSFIRCRSAVLVCGFVLSPVGTTRCRLARVRLRPFDDRSMSAGGALLDEEKSGHPVPPFPPATARRNPRRLMKSCLRSPCLQLLFNYSLLNGRIFTDRCANLLIGGAFLQIGGANLLIGGAFLLIDPTENRLTRSPKKWQNDTQLESRTPGEFRNTTGDERQPYARSAAGHDGRRHTILDSPLGPLLP